MACPNCNQNDQVQKIETLMEKLPSGAVNLHQSNPLAHRLRPPYRPDPPPTAQAMQLPSLVEWFITSLIALVIALIVTFTIGSGWEGAARIGLCLGAYLVSTILVSLTVMRVIQAIVVTQREPEARKMRQQYEEVTYPRWEQALKNWNELEYCHRCGVVFMPGKSEYVEPERMAELIYPPAEN